VKSVAASVARRLAVFWRRGADSVAFFESWE